MDCDEFVTFPLKTHDVPVMVQGPEVETSLRAFLARLKGIVVTPGMALVVAVVPTGALVVEEDCALVPVEHPASSRAPERAANKKRGLPDRPRLLRLPLVPIVRNVLQNSEPRPGAPRLGESGRPCWELVSNAMTVESPAVRARPTTRHLMPVGSPPGA